MNGHHYHRGGAGGGPYFDNRLYQIYSLGNLDVPLQKGSETIPRACEMSPIILQELFLHALDNLPRLPSDEFRALPPLLSAKDGHTNEAVPDNHTMDMSNGDVEVNPLLNSLDILHQPRFLQCLGVGCRSIFRSVEAWKNHNISCHHSHLAQEGGISPSLQCPFISCTKLFSAPTSLQNHYSQSHLVYVCSRSGCQLAFEQEAHAQRHLCKDGAEPVHHLPPRVLLSLEPKNWSLEEIQKGAKLAPSSCVSCARFFAAPDPQSVENMDGSLEVNEGLAMSGAPSSTSSTPSPPTPEIPRSIPHSLGIIPREPTIFLSPGSGGGISEPHHIPQAAFQPRIKPLTYTVPTEEPPVATVLTCNEQKKYLFLLRHICVKAAHAFYSDHNLRAALDKKHIPIFLTKDKQIARLPFDLTLPQWTQHLRKACDTRFITADIVQCIESFKGEIQPVDEVHHALVKGKTKSDRALLAVIEAARTFVKQLKDWEMCEMVDSVYNEVELLILLKKRAMAADIGEGGGDASRNTRRRTWN